MYETLDGYTVLFDGSIGAYCYAKLSEDGTELESTGLEVGTADPGVLGLPRGIRIHAEGTTVADLLEHRFPGTVGLGTITTFESTPAVNSGSVISGYLTPPVTGPYVFFLASANAAELWLSTGTDANDAVRIAREDRNNTKRNWAGYGSTNHISGPVVLEQGKWYYVKAIHKGGRVGPHCAVAWQLPGGQPPAAGSEPISGEFLTWALPRSDGASGNSVGLALGEDGQLILSFAPGGNSVNWVLQASEDLVNWAPVATNMAPQVNLWSVDPASTNQAQRFYRAVME